MDMLIKNTKKIIENTDKNKETEEYWDKWDKQMEEDYKNGKLDFFLEIALNAEKEGSLKPL
ncbi:MAG TPA: hypothetical protein PL110_01295 [Candidatus Eremiobacteraeota bacterium]|mgnify:CR=1 FL=1|nr:MAG: hypothetical protein BWY64_03259 [bacterium ADurb.Bin363]HPZ06722.1 hypothetical protein [Candidatus Eremiobacteraeota bacterium]